MRASRIRTLSARRAAARMRNLSERRAALRAAGAGRELASDEADEAAGERELAGSAELVAGGACEHDELVLLAVEGLVVAHFVGRDHVEILLHELGARVLLDRLGLGGE